MTREQLIVGGRKSPILLAFNRLKSINLKKGLFGETVIFHLTDGSVINFAGLTKQRAIELTTLLHANINWPTIQSLYHHYCSLTSGLSYIAQSEIAIFLKSRSDAALLPLTHIPVLEATDKERAFIVKAVLRPDEVIRENVRQRNIQFVEQEKQNFASLFDTLEKYPLTEEQRLAIIRNEDNNLVIAGAGSGKTSTLVGRIGYLLKKGVPAESILVLAFAKKAAEELRERIKSKFDVDLEVQTFHALGLKIIGAVETKKPSLAKEAEADSGKAMAKTLETIFEDRLSSDREFREKVISTYISFRQPYQPEHEFKTEHEYNEYISPLNLKTLRSQMPQTGKSVSIQGETVKSLAELEIADTLFTNGIEYQYEAEYKFQTADSQHSQYKPDFYLPEYDLYIEHFGLDQQGHTAPFVDEVKYNLDMEWKIKLHKTNQTRLVETFSWMMSEGILGSKLLSTLTEKYGVKLRPLSQEEVLSHIKSAEYSTALANLCSTFIALFKSNNYSFDNLRVRAEHIKGSKRALRLLYLFEHLTSDYQNKLCRAGQIDFSDMIIKAIDYGKTGRFTMRVSHILVDEFQDIAACRAELVRVIRNQNPQCRLFAVGDDWQSIYRFTGSDIDLMTNFDKHFGPTSVTLLQDTFRCNNKIVEFSSRFILKNKSQIKKKLLARKFVEKPCVHIRIQQEPMVNGEAYAKALRINLLNSLEQTLDQLLDPTHKEKVTVFILGRYHSALPQKEDLIKLQQKFRNLDICAHTIHSVKGLEAEHVILVEMKGGEYGFPSQISDDPLLSLLLSRQEDCPFGEERRLFYVAVTRAKKSVHLFTHLSPPSQFVLELISEQREYGVEIYLPSGEKTGVCPICRIGILQHAKGKNGSYYKCSNKKFCDYTESQCSKCEKGIMIAQGNEHRCTHCGSVPDRCPLCGGRLRLIRCQNGDFEGCENYSTKKCKFKRKRTLVLTPE